MREGERKEGSKEEGSGEQARRGVRLLYYTALWGRGGAILAAEAEEADFDGRTDGPESARPRRRRTGRKSQQPDGERERPVPPCRLSCESAKKELVRRGQIYITACTT